MTKKYDYIVHIGLFQPPNRADIKLMDSAIDQCEKLIVLVGSPNKPRTIATPWTYEEREAMIENSVSNRNNVICKPLPDILYNNQQWVQQVQEIIDKITEKLPLAEIGIIGHTSVEKSTFLKLFPQWDTIIYNPGMEVGPADDIQSVFDLRASYYMMTPEDFDARMGKHIPNEIHTFLKAFSLREEYDQLVREYKFLLKYWESWEGAPHPVIFVTSDAVVIQSGHVLLVRRRSEPGKGLWAIPGGFVNPYETVEDAAIRELREETKLKVPMPVLYGSIKANDVYDHPQRSLRGRTITHATIIELTAGDLPKVKGSDDADKARWVPLSVFADMEDQLFEDHFHIVKDMIGKL